MRAQSHVSLTIRIAWVLRLKPTNSSLEWIKIIILKLELEVFKKKSFKGRSSSPTFCFSTDSLSTHYHVICSHRNTPYPQSYCYHLRPYRASDRLQTLLPYRSGLLSRLLVLSFDWWNYPRSTVPNYAGEEATAWRVAGPRRVYRYYFQSHESGCPERGPWEERLGFRSVNTCAQAALATSCIAGV